jgi:polyisoprenoid-binding protein YceI
MRCHALACLAAFSLAGPAMAVPVHYQLDAAASQVGFQITSPQSNLKGLMPVATADITLDFDKAAASNVKVALDASRTEMGLPFATDALKSDSVLFTKSYPTIDFQSTSIRSDGQGAVVQGKVTIRGVTRPLTLQAQIFRPAGSAQGSRDVLTVKLSGVVHRHEFGATGFPDLAGDDVHLNIKVRILKQ